MIESSEHLTQTNFSFSYHCPTEQFVGATGGVNYDPEHILSGFAQGSHLCTHPWDRIQDANMYFLFKADGDRIEGCECLKSHSFAAPFR